MNRSRPVTVCAVGLAALAGCASTGDDAHFRPEQGWSLCRAPMPVDMASFSGTREEWTKEQRTDIAGAIGLAIAHQCLASDTVAEQARGYRGITAMNVPDANQVSVYPAGGKLVFDVPAYADFRSAEFQADLRNGIACGLAPGEAAGPDDCLPD